MPGKYILVVDDQIAIRNFLQKVCEKMGHEVTTATTGEEAFKSITQGNYDLILLDMLMPGWDGPTTLKGLDFYKIKAKVIVISGLSAQELESELSDVKSKISAFVQKPFGLEYIRDLIKQTLEE